MFREITHYYFFLNCSLTAHLCELAPPAGVKKSITIFVAAFKDRLNKFFPLYTSKTKRGVCATKSKRVGESDPPPLSLPLLCYARHIIQVELWVSPVQVQCGWQDSMVTRQGCKGCFEGTRRPEEMACCSLGGGDCQRGAVLLKESFDGSILRSVPQWCGGSMCIHVRHICRCDACVAESGGHAPISNLCTDIW